MQTVIHNLLDRFEHLPRLVSWLILLAATVLIGLLDYQTGYEASVSVLYLIPVLLVAWSLGLGAGLVFAFADSGTLILANWWAGQVYSETWVMVWNIVVRGAVHAMVAYLAAMLRRQLAEAHLLSLTDALTGAWNRRAFYQAIAKEMARALRGAQPFSLVYIDVDNFKDINDRLGHKAGDKVLQTVVSICKQTLRQSDTIARLGGDEFALLLPDTDETTLRSVLPRLQEILKSTAGDQTPVTFSIGAVTCLHPPPTVEAVVQHADALMYQVKRSSKDNIIYSVYPSA